MSLLQRANTTRTLVVPKQSFKRNGVSTLINKCQEPISRISESLILTETEYCSEKNI